MAEGGWVVLATSEKKFEKIVQKHLIRQCEHDHLFLWSWVLEVVRRNSGGGMNEVR